MIELAAIKQKYDKIAGAIEEVNATGYGIVMPTMEELTLEEPEIVKQGGKYGVRLKASAPSIHIMRNKQRFYLHDKKANGHPVTGHWLFCRSILACRRLKNACGCL